MTNTLDHLKSDAGEVAAISLIAGEFERKNVADNSNGNLSESKLNDLMEHLSNYPILGDLNTFSKTKYYKTSEKWIPKFVSDVIKTYPNSNFDILDVEKEYRINGLKGDFAINTNDGKTISTSLKNYKGGISSIQVSSGTMNSFVCKLFFESVGTGKVKSPDGEVWQTGGNKGDTYKHEKRDRMFKKWIPSYSLILEGLYKLDELNLEVKNEFAYSDRHEFYNEEVFDKARKRISHEGAIVIMEMLKKADSDFLKKRVMKLSGMDGEEELLAVSEKEYLCSIGNPKYKEYLRKINEGKLKFEFTFSQGDSTKYSGIRFFFEYEGTEIFNATVPTTINSNGCWFEKMKKQKFTGKKQYKDEGWLSWRQRRPGKSKEIALSTNFWIYLNKTECGIVDEI